MRTFLDSPLCTQLVLTLGHFLWQGVLIGVLVWLVSFALRRRSAAARYRLLFLALIVLAACPVLTFTWVVSDPPRLASLEPSVLNEPAGLDDSSQVSSPSVATDDSESTTTMTEFVAGADDRNGFPSERSALGTATEVTGSQASASQPLLRRLAPWLLSVYLAGVLLMLIRLLLGLRGGGRLRRHSQPVTDVGLLELLTRRAAVLRMRSAPVFAWCDRVAVPTVVGVIRPAILLPASLSSGMTPEQLSAILTHELAHIRRWDPLVNVLQRLIEALLFFHPVVWIVSAQMRRERENCCDDLVLATGSDPSGYASTLLEIVRIAKTRRITAAKPSLERLVAMGADGQASELGGRIRRLLGAEQHAAVRLRHPGLAWTGIATVVALVALSQIVVNAEQDADDAQPTPAKVTLPNGVEVELVGVGFHPSADRRWWKPDGSPLEKRPYEESGVKVMTGSPEQADCREFRIEVRGLPSDHAVTTGYGSVSAASGSVYSDGLWVGDHAAGPFETPTTSVGVGIATEPLGPIQTISVEGQVEQPLPESADLKPLYGQVEPLRVEPADDRDGTVLIFDGDAINALRNQAHWEIHAIDHEGKRQRSTFSMGTTENESHIGFPIPRSRIARFEYRLRPYRYWVTFENVSLAPDLNTQVRVEVQTPETVSLDEWSRIIATRVATQLPFTSNAHRQQTKAEFRQLVKTHGAGEPGPERFTHIRKALDRHMKLEFPDGPYPGDSGSVHRDENYLKLPSVIRMLQWRLFMALQRSLGEDDRSKLEEQMRWMRQYVRSLPDPPESFDRDGFATNRALAKLQEKFQDPLQAVFHEPLSENQFQAFQQAMEEFRGRQGDRAVLSVVHHLVGEYHRIAYRDRDVPVPQLAAFDEPSHSLRIRSGRVQLGFRRAASFQGRSNAINDFYQQGILIVLSDPTPGIVSVGVEGAPGRDASLNELGQWLEQGHDRGDLIFDEDGMRLVGVRGTRLVPLEQRRFYEVDALATEQLVEKVKQEGLQAWDLPEPISEDSISGDKYDSLAAVLTGDGELHVIQIQEHGRAGLRFHARRHQPGSGG